VLLEAPLALRVGRAREVELLELRPRVVRAVLACGLELDGRLRRAAPLEQLADAREDPRLEVRVRVRVRARAWAGARARARARARIWVRVRARLRLRRWLRLRLRPTLRVKP
jgi:hypothetical protein